MGKRAVQACVRWAHLAPLAPRHRPCHPWVQVTASLNGNVLRLSEVRRTAHCSSAMAVTACCRHCVSSEITTSLVLPWTALTNMINDVFKRACSPQQCARANSSCDAPTALHLKAVPAPAQDRQPGRCHIFYKKKSQKTAGTRGRLLTSQAMVTER